MTETQDEVVVEEENNDIRSEENEVIFTPEIQLKETLDNVEVKELETVEVNTREAVFPIEFREDAQSRTMTMSVSSESPVGREFGNEILRYQGKDAIGGISFPKSSGNFTTCKIGIMKSFKFFDLKFDTDPIRKYSQISIGLNNL